ncbi:enoyl-CoA hydratase/isomerase family protein [Candidatus Poriferisocius sp.]|uniref:enoyl-CoA hydratase/isomerase family protein n=1 Tax=Candidatus Poriferisocius sp. TaxID=3101276 RepID=UPI003B01AF6F
MPSYENLLYEESDGVAVITLNRPERLNALDNTSCDELRAVWAHLRYNDDVQCVILTATGERAFSSGVDITGSWRQPSSPFMVDDPISTVGPKSNDYWRPVIAAVNGMAAGGAFYLLGEVEFIIAADHATFFDPHVSHGMAAVNEPMFMLQRMPLGEVMRLSLLGRHERMSAQRAFQIGLVQEVVPVGELMGAARWCAEAIVAAPEPVAIEATMRGLWTAQSTTLANAMNSGVAFLSLAGAEEQITEKARGIKEQTRIEPRIR